MGSLGPNLSSGSAARVGKCIGELSKVVQHYDKDNGIKGDTGKHSRRSMVVDLTKILKELRDADVLGCYRDRGHKY